MNNLLYIIVFCIAITFWYLNIRICPVYYFLNIPCVGCGLTRSVVYLLKGNVIESIKYNILGIPLILAFALYFILCIFKKDEVLKIIVKQYKKVIIIMAIIMTIMVQIININNPLLYS